MSGVQTLSVKGSSLPSSSSFSIRLHGLFFTIHNSQFRFIFTFTFTITIVCRIRVTKSHAGVIFSRRDSWYGSLVVLWLFFDSSLILLHFTITLLSIFEIFLYIPIRRLPTARSMPSLPPSTSRTITRLKTVLIF